MSVYPDGGHGQKYLFSAFVEASPLGSSAISVKTTSDIQRGVAYEQGFNEAYGIPTQ